MSMELRTGPTTVDQSELDAIAAEARRQSVPAYVLATAGTPSREAFFDAVRDTLPLNPPVISSDNWDALSDSLWEGIDSLNANQVIVLWPDAAGLRATSPTDYAAAIAVLRDVAELLADPDATMGKPTQLCIYVGRRSEPMAVSTQIGPGNS